jgi:hypothetical protein
MFTQLPPELLQSIHWYENDVGLPFQLPLLVLSVWPWTAWPLTTGAAVLVGAAGGGAATIDVAAESADPDPPALVAVTSERIVLPTSLDCNV